MEIGFLKPIILINAALGGAISLLLMHVLPGVSFLGLQMLLFRLGYLSLWFFSESVDAIGLLMLAMAYLPAGFVGGLFTGYRIKENLRFVLLIPGLIGFVGLIVVRYVTGNMNLQSLNVQLEILVPLLGSVIGAYLGGYTLNWEMKETGPLETIGFDMSQVRS